MASQPASHDRITGGSSSQSQNQVDQSDPQRPRQQPEDTAIHVTTAVPRSSSSHSKASNRSIRLPEGTAELHLQPPRSSARIAFHNPRDISAATLGSPEGIEHDFPYSAHNQPNRSRYSHSHSTPPAQHENRSSWWSGILGSRGSTIAPYQEPLVYPISVRQRLQKTYDRAVAERDKSMLTARSARWSMYCVAGAQVLLGAMTTGLSALRLDGQKSGAATTALGILSTLSGSYLAHIRATNEPETSIVRMNKLDAFIRQLEDFMLDYGHDTTDKYDDDVKRYRRELDDYVLAKDSLMSTARTRSPVDEDRVRSAPSEVRQKKEEA